MEASVGSDHAPVELGAFVTAIRDIDAALLAGADRDLLMLRILESGLRLLSADAGEVFVRSPGGFDAVAWSGLSERPTYTIAPGSGITGRAASERRSVAVEDYVRDAPASAGTAARATAVKEGLRSIAAVPLLDGDDVLGVVNLARRDVRPFTAGELRIAEALAGQAAIALRVAALVAAERAAAEAAHAATRAKSDFLAGMSHELRTPLNAILGFSEILMEQASSALTDPQRRYLGNIRQAGEHLLGLINDVLDLSRVEAGRIDLRPETFRIGAIVDPVIAATHTAADERGVAFDPGEIPSFAVRIDAGRIRQVLYNLLSNAVKFTPPGGRVTLRVRQEEASLAFEVSDTGIGIPLGRQERVFGVFERLHEGRSDATGTGLGLAVTRRLVELHGGTISFESRENEGTTFRVFIPDVVVEPPAGARVLIVEDVPTDAELIAATAAEFSLATELVSSAGAAIEAIRRDPPRGVVLDLRLPDQRGEQVLTALKDDPRTRGVPVIVVTVEDDEGRSRRLGADDHITKPIDRQRLGAWLARLRAEDPTGARAPR